MFKQYSNSKPTVEVLETCMPKILISKEALIKMSIYVDECSDEIGWLGTAYKQEDGSILIHDVYLFEQDVHSTTTEITPEGLTKFAEELLNQENGIEIWNNLKVWGHSHVNMTPTPSGQDNKQMVTFADGGHDWFIRIIANKKDEMRVDLYNFDEGIIYNNLPWVEVVSDEELKLKAELLRIKEQLNKIDEQHKEKHKEAIKKEIKNKVNKISTKGVTTIHNLNKARVYDSYESIYNPKKIKTSEDVKKYFDTADLIEIGSSEFFWEAKRTINYMGYRKFTDEEIRIIWTTSKDVVKDFINGEIEGGK